MLCTIAAILKACFPLTQQQKDDYNLAQMARQFNVASQDFLACLEAHIMLCALSCPMLCLGQWHVFFFTQDRGRAEDASSQACTEGSSKVKTLASAKAELSY